MFLSDELLILCLKCILLLFHRDFSLVYICCFYSPGSRLKIISFLFVRILHKTWGFLVDYYSVWLHGMLAEIMYLFQTFRPLTLRPCSQMGWWSRKLGYLCFMDRKWLCSFITVNVKIKYIILVEIPWSHIGAIGVYFQWNLIFSNRKALPDLGKLVSSFILEGWRRTLVNSEL